MDRRPTLNLQRRKHLKTIERRLDYLKDVITEPSSPNAVAWDQAEIAALQFAVRTINAHYQKAQP